MPAKAGGALRTSVRQLQSIARSLTLLSGLDATTAAEIAQLDADDWLEYSRIDALFDAAAARLAQPAVGLLAAEHIVDGTYDALEYAVRSATDLGAALSLINRYIRLVGEAARYIVVEDGPRLLWQLTSLRPDRRAFSDYVVAHMVIGARALTGRDLVPSEVRFTHAQPADIAHYTRIFRCPVTFAARVNAIVFPREYAQLPILSGDDGLHRVMRRYAQQLADQLPEPDDFEAQVRGVLARGMSGGDMQAAGVAKRLQLSERTLRRRLLEHGTTLRELTTAVQRDLAEHYLQQAELSVSDVAFLLGFSDNTAFHRAFRRWTGTTPQEYRTRRS